MPENDSFGALLLDQSAKPLPWTNGGPNEDSKQNFSYGVNRYKCEELPKKGNDAKNRKHHLNWFEKHLGKIKFSSIRSSDIKDANSS